MVTYTKWYISPDNTGPFYTSPINVRAIWTSFESTIFQRFFGNTQQTFKGLEVARVAQWMQNKIATHVNSSKAENLKNFKNSLGADQMTEDWGMHHSDRRVHPKPSRTHRTDFIFAIHSWPSNTKSSIRPSIAESRHQRPKVTVRTVASISDEDHWQLPCWLA